MPESNTQTNKQSATPTDPEPEPAGPVEPAEPENLIVEVANRHTLKLPESRISELAGKIFEDFRWTQGEVSIAIVDDPTIHQLNREYLQHDYETDVLSFVFEQREQDRFLSGEIIVSADTAARVADQQGVSLLDELLLYVLHGTLHLVGLDDKDEVSRKTMRETERRYSEQFGIVYRCPDDSEPAEGAS